MRPASFERTIKFRESEAIAAGLRARAQQEGTTPAALIRRAVRRELQDSSEPPPTIKVEIKAETPFTTRAALGDGEAHAVMANAHYQGAVSGKVPPIIALGQASLYARLAAISRGTRQDWANLIFLLDEYSYALRDQNLGDLADTAQAEAVTYANVIADEGDEQFGQALVMSGENISPRVMQMAKGLHEYAKDYCDAGSVSHDAP